MVAFFHRYELPHIMNGRAQDLDINVLNEFNDREVVQFLFDKNLSHNLLGKSKSAHCFEHHASGHRAQSVKSRKY